MNILKTKILSVDKARPLDRLVNISSLEGRNIEMGGDYHDT
jgi:hypothetical protein